MTNSWNLYKNLHQISSHPQWNPFIIQGWWVTGGLVNSSGSATPTTELFNSSSGTFVKGPDLPFALHKHCLVQIAAGWARSIAMISSFAIFRHFAILSGQKALKRACDTNYQHLMALPPPLPRQPWERAFSTTGLQSLGKTSQESLMLREVVQEIKINGNFSWLLHYEGKGVSSAFKRLF